METVTGEDKDREYRGSAHKTINDVVCQEWASQLPHAHVYTPENNPEAGLVSNFCRNPGDE